MADIPSPPPGTIAYAEWKRRQAESQPAQAREPETRETGKLARKEVSKEVSQEERKERRREAIKEEKPTFKSSFLYTEKEFETFEDLKTDVRRKHGLKMTKNDLARAGIRLLAEDYEKNQETSFLVKRFLGKQGRK